MYVKKAKKSKDFIVHKFTLTCNEDDFKNRLEAAGREEAKIAVCIESLRQCERTESEKIDTTQRSVEEVARILHDRIQAGKA